ncbi:hypothetical protein LTR66_017102 [Elasticomyces elasticus]|nr:hypothetical protein LTR66_017102 [Elasticomyces elasticus]
MAHTNLSHRRTHNVLLISRLLNHREGASPLTLVLDTLEQPAKPLLREYIRRANLSRTHIVLLSFSTPRAPPGISTFIPCWSKSSVEITRAVATATSSIPPTTKRCLILIDSLHPLCKHSLAPKSQLNLTHLLMGLLQPTRTNPKLSLSIVAVFHTDILIPSTSTSYNPAPLTLLSYLATTVITLHSLPILLAEKSARERSQVAPRFGLAEEKQGVLLGLHAASKIVRSEDKGLILEVEHRRKSGRGVIEWYFLPSTSLSSSKALSAQAFKEPAILLDDHPLFRRAPDPMSDRNMDDELAGVTFDLKLSERQRLERDGVVLPYFDAQKAGGGTDGGRILYDMGVEDDFDEEEDEI